MPSDMGQISVEYKRTLNQDNFESLTIGVVVTLPIEAKARDDAKDVLEFAFADAKEQADNFLSDMEKTFSNGYITRVSQRTK